MTTAGSVDDGKSTLIGRLLYDCNDIYEDQLANLGRDENGEIDGADLALITDGLAAEREQQITIDVAYRHFSRPKRKFIIADVPGHEQYTRNMVTGASKADLALILTDARKGLLIQSKRHLFIASLLGIPHILIVVNKMDLVDYSQITFEKIKKDFIDYAAKMNIHDLQFIPVAAIYGDMVVKRGDNMEWYNGPTLLSYLENVQISPDRNLIDFRLPVQYVIRPHQDLRGYAGTIVSGTIAKGEEVKILPSGQETKIKSIICDGREKDEAFNPQAVILTLQDELDISRGEMIVRKNNLPEISNCFSADICWFAPEPLKIGRHYLIKHTTKITRGVISQLFYKIDIDNLRRQKTDCLALNEIGKVEIRTNEPLFFDAYAKNKNTGSFIIIDELTNNTVGVGMIISAVKKLEAVSTPLPDQTVKPQKGFVLWFTGLPAAGKSTLANEVYEKLKQRNIKIERLDGDEVRKNLTKDLGFSKADRDENIHRVGFVANLLSRNGVGVIASFVSPYCRQREELRRNIENFIEIFVDTPLAVCEQRDPKGHYRQARAGEIQNFTGVSDPYEKPENPQIHILTEKESLAERLNKIFSYLEKNNFIS